jgi:hypothetical protein
VNDLDWQGRRAGKMGFMMLLYRAPLSIKGIRHDDGA